MITLTILISLLARLLSLGTLVEQKGILDTIEETEFGVKEYTASEVGKTTRVPAEWEEHAATWMQWPNWFEAEMRPDFARMIKIIQTYEPLHLIVGTINEKRDAQQFLVGRGVPERNITWHILPVDNAWIRDNGPVYVTDGTQTRIQNWKFDAWGGNFSKSIEYQNDNNIPVHIAQYLEIPVENRQDYVLEKGNLEFNGAGILVLNWDCQHDRNPGLTRARHEDVLKEAFGVHTILWAYGHDPEDATTGHIDGTARFIDRETLVIADLNTDTELDLAQNAKTAGLEVIWYPGDPNWLVGNGFVLALKSGQDQLNARLKTQLESMFPERDVYLIDAHAIAAAGGGIHCVTNDQPVIE